MKRRGSSFCRSEVAPMFQQFSVGDIVTPLFLDTYPVVHGTIVDVRPKEAKIYVAWNNGPIKQHDPDEIQVVPFEARRVSRVVKKSKDLKSEDKYVGDPKTHGIDKPRGGGFSILQDLADDLHEESYEEAQKQTKEIEKELKNRRGSRLGETLLEKSTTWHEDGSVEKKVRMWEDDYDYDGDEYDDEDDEDEVFEVSDLRRAVYHNERGRIYRRTRLEGDSSVLICPRCKSDGLELQPFTKSVKIYICPECGWKITTDKLI